MTENEDFQKDQGFGGMEKNSQLQIQTTNIVYHIVLFIQSVSIIASYEWDTRWRYNTEQAHMIPVLTQLTI